MAHAVHALPGVNGCVVLVTCHRSEVYVTSRDPAAVRHAVAAHFRSERYRRSVTPQGQALEPRSPLRELSDADTIRHIFRVASGLDSVLVGETDVLGQVRSALRIANQAGTVDNRTRSLFEAAIETGRRVRAETDLGTGPRSLGAAVWRALRPRLPPEGGRVVLVGAGQAAASIAESTPAPLRGSLAVLNRSAKRGQELARRVDGTFRPLADLPAALREADACVLAAPVSLPTMPTRPREADRGLLVLDVCQPPILQNVEPERPLEYWDLSQVLANGSTGSVVADATMQAAYRLVDEAVARFERQEQEPATPAGHLLRLLHIEGEQIAQRELQTALRRLPDLEPQERTVLEDFARAIRKKLLMRPTLALRRSLEAGRPDAAHEILDLFAGASPSRDATGAEDDP